MVTVVMIVEMLGRPPEHLSEQLEEHVGQLEKIKEVEILKKSFSEPKKVDEKSDLFTSFSEVEFKCKDFRQLMDIVFDFMPSSVEILDPVRIDMSLDEATSMVNNLSGRLHRYDDVVKIMKNREEMAKAREEKFMKELRVAAKIFKAYGLIGEDKKLKKEVIDKIGEKRKESKEDSLKKKEENKKDN